MTEKITPVYKSDLFFKKFDYPELPTELEIESYNCISPENCTLNYRYYKKFNVSEPIKKWLEQNIPILGTPSSNDDYAIQKLFKTYADRPPHTDGCGSFLLYYIITSGGDRVTTNWYQEDCFPLMRFPNYKLSSFEKTTKVFSTVLPIKKWILFESSILHNVSNMRSDRIGLAIRIFR